LIGAKISIMKRLFLPVLALCLVAGSTSAQQVKEKYKQKSGQHMRGGIEHDLDRLNLTTDQRTQINTLNTNYRLQLETLRNENLSESERATRHESIQKQHMESVRAVLTEEQRVQLDAMQASDDKGPGGKYKIKGDGAEIMEGDMSRQLETLNLSDEQKNRIAAVNQEHRSQMDALRSQNLSKEDMRARKHELQQQHVQNIKAVLTAEQRTRLEARMHDRKGKEIKQKNKDGKMKYKTKS
jgi:Spy/CpxP family protein refolding chaperone